MGGWGNKKVAAIGKVRSQWPNISCSCTGAYVYTCAQFRSFYDTWPGGLLDDGNNANTRQTIHDCIGSLAFMSNEPTGVKN